MCAHKQSSTMKNDSMINSLIVIRSKIIFSLNIFLSQIPSKIEQAFSPQNHSHNMNKSLKYDIFIHHKTQQH
ncbi:hypothetical protein Lalb_Chr01g0016331 [Lupinus albus]|uniref:Uncharacterized protein n=1 Tax=Lupinus albus TaxID=3870 RepID=A0A6A4R7D8_LUPAL|nr:hypothetical protein Lalb_Chr01g0016331 [Lupinus albus]